jgi:hypothetical protein
MNIVFQDLIGINMLVYIDDILVFGSDYDEHKRNLEIVLDRMKMYGLEENVDKRRECVEKVEFLGFEISLNNIKPTCKRSQGITDFSTPRSRKELQRFLGMLNYDRNFVRGITELEKPLYGLLQKDVHFKWDIMHENAFTNLKRKWEQKLEL